MIYPGAYSGPGVAAAKLRVIDVLRTGVDDWLAAHRPTPEQARFIRDLRRCRTAALGGHLYICPRCEFGVPVYNSCGNRHCPNCQALDQERWIAEREAVLLPVGHHHVVFTLPSQLRTLALRHPREIYGLLFNASAETLAMLAEDMLDAVLGITAVLHTWRRDLGHHPHLHCIVSGGGLSTDGTRWVERDKFLFPVARMKALFRARVLDHLHMLYKSGALPMSEQEWRWLLHSLPRKRKWVVYTEPPFGRSTHVLQYLGRYTHRVAISDARLVSADASFVRFTTKDGNIAELPLEKFVGRFLLHVLPKAFHKIRHFGLYAPGNAKHRLDLARQIIGPGDNDEIDEIDAVTVVEVSEPEIELNDPTALPIPKSPGDKYTCPRCGHQGMLHYILQRVRPPKPSWRPP